MLLELGQPHLSQQEGIWGNLGTFSCRNWELFPSSVQWDSPTSLIRELVAH